MKIAMKYIMRFLLRFKKETMNFWSKKNGKALYISRYCYSGPIKPQITVYRKGPYIKYDRNLGGEEGSFWNCPYSLFMCQEKNENETMKFVLESR